MVVGIDLPVYGRWCQEEDTSIVDTYLHPNIAPIYASHAPRTTMYLHMSSMYICMAVGVCVERGRYIYWHLSTPATHRTTVPHNPPSTAIFIFNDFQIHYFDVTQCHEVIIGNVIDSSAAVVRNGVTWRRDGSSPVVAKSREMQCRRHVRRGVALPTLCSNIHFCFINMSSVYISGLAR